MKETFYKFENGILEVKIKDKWNKVEYGGYQFVEYIGSGANSVVIKAMQKVLNRIVAIKVWLPNIRSQDKIVSKEQFENEVQKLANLDHKNIVKIYDGRVINNNIYMAVMEYIKGETLQEWVETSRYDHVKINVCRDILETILFYQEKGIIHGDLHDRNIIIGKNNEVHLIDFGTSFRSKITSENRESYFVNNITSKVLSSLYDGKRFLFKEYPLRENPTNLDDVRLFKPNMITKTMLSYLDALEIELAGEMDQSNLIAYGMALARGCYFNFTTICNFIKEKSTDRSYISFLNAVRDAFYDQIFDVKNYDDMDEIFYLTLYTYYEGYIKHRDKVKKEDLKIDLMNLLGNNVELTNSILLGKIASYTDLAGEIYCGISNKKEFEHIENEFRKVFSKIYKKNFENDFIMMQSLWIRINELRSDQSLYESIINLSENRYS